ncbi:hypothetical protein CPter91_0625 [Collimonas pratensis]|uniref:Uncharacterized protein n=1 Tax=Collimonas pratensis TaxID=279113 RepID=A0A127PYW6_9BURK|nr:hypothetical protein CPter91_0625 [Collimonas pratensis]
MNTKHGVIYSVLEGRYSDHDEAIKTGAAWLPAIESERTI